MSHTHWCPQCEEVWECWCQDKAEVSEKWCPHGDLCHIKKGETADVHTIPKRRRKSNGVGTLFSETSSSDKKS